MDVSIETRRIRGNRNPRCIKAPEEGCDIVGSCEVEEQRTIVALTYAVKNSSNSTCTSVQLTISQLYLLGFSIHQEGESNSLRVIGRSPLKELHQGGKLWDIFGETYSTSHWSSIISLKRDAKVTRYDRLRPTNPFLYILYVSADRSD
jgi:hypothetical protein